jgi:6-phosphofructokinase 2
MDIMTLTMNPAVDISVGVKQLVAGKKLRCNTPIYEAGGGGINVATVIQELGGKAVAVYAAGGATGQMLQNLLADKGIDQEYIEIEGRTREDISVLEETSGQLYRFVMPGPEINQKEQAQCLKKLQSFGSFPKYLVISGSLPPAVPSDFYRQVIREMKTHGTRIILDTKADTLKEVSNEGVFLIKPNMNELRELAGRDLNEEKDQEKVSRNLIEQGKAEVVVVSLGAAGVLVVSGELNERIRAPSVPIKSRVGAGDSMVAGTTLALSRGRTIKQAIRFGVAAGSAAVMTPGTELCRRQDVERLFSRLSEQ